MRSHYGPWTTAIHEKALLATFWKRRVKAIASVNMTRPANRLSSVIVVGVAILGLGLPTLLAEPGRPTAQPATAAPSESDTVDIDHTSHEHAALPEIPDYVVYKVTTELQRRLLPPETISYVEIDGRQLVTSEAWNEELLSALRAELARVEDKNGRVQIRVHFTTRDLQSRDGSQRRRQESVLRQVAVTAGFQDARVGRGVSHPGNPWPNRLALREPALDATPGEQENGSRDGRVTAFPVHTPLSRLLAHGADCVVDIEGPIRNGKIDPELRRSIGSAVRDVDVARKNSLAIRMRISVGRRSPAEQLPLTEEAEAVATTLGFDRAQILGTNPRPEELRRD